MLDYDAVKIIGGNPFYLLNQLRRKNVEDILRKIGQEKTLIGVSADGIVLQKSIELIAAHSPEMNNEFQLKDLAGLSIVDVEILPHYGRFLSRLDKFEEHAREFDEKNSCSK